MIINTYWLLFCILLLEIKENWFFIKTLLFICSAAVHELYVQLKKKKIVYICLSTVFISKRVERLQNFNKNIIL